MTIEVLSHSLQQGAQVAAGHSQVQDTGIERFFGDDHDIQGGNGLGRAQPKAFAQHAFDTVARDGIADFFADGHAQPPGGVPFRTRPDEQKEVPAMKAAACLEAGREFLLSSEPVCRGEA